MLDLFHLVLQIAVILVAARMVGFLFQKINQPQVMGEMVAGILLGPSLLGWLAPGVSAALFPPASLGYLNALSQVGLVVFMFVVGLALNPSELHGYGHAAVLTSHVSIVAPFCLGGLTALYLYPRLSDDGVTFTGFALFIGAAMSITAFPVLARILSERGPGAQPIGHAGDRLRGGGRRHRLVHPGLHRGARPRLARRPAGLGDHRRRDCVCLIHGPRGTPPAARV